MMSLQMFLILIFITIFITVLGLIIGEILSHHYKRFKVRIYERDICFEKISFFKFLVLFSEIECRDDFCETTILKQYVDLYHVVRLTTDVAMLGNQKFAYFNSINYLMYYVWLTHYSKKQIKKRNFHDKEIKGLFDEKGEVD